MLQSVRMLVLLVLFGGMAYVSPAHSQTESDSHVLIPGGIGNRDDAADLLLARLGRAKDFKNVRKLAEDLWKRRKELGLDKMMQKIAEDFRKRPDHPNFDPNDPAWKDVFRKALKDQKLSKEQKESLENIVGDLRNQGELPENPENPQNPENPENPENPQNPNNPNGNQPENPPPGPENPANPTPPGAQPGNPPPPNPPAAPPNWAQNQLDNIKDWISGPGNGSGGAPQWMKDLGIDFSGMTGELGSTISKWLPDVSDLKMGGFLKDMTDWLPTPDGMSFPDIDIGGAPDVSVGSPSISTSGLSGFGTVLMIIVAGLVVGAILFALVAGSKAWLERHPVQAWKLGPWPVRPEAIRTQEELIKAFEYLALLRLGREVTSSNHLEIAQQIADLHGHMLEQSQAADHLADLYEKARYAPPHEAVPSEDVIAARRELCLLAGVSQG